MCDFIKKFFFVLILKLILKKQNNSIDNDVVYFLLGNIPANNTLICIGHINSWKTTLV